MNAKRQPPPRRKSAAPDGSVNRVSVPARKTRLGSSYPELAATGNGQEESRSTLASATLGNAGVRNGRMMADMPMDVRIATPIARMKECSAPLSSYSRQAKRPTRIGAAKEG